jgi:hypothetical protein
MDIKINNVVSVNLVNNASGNDDKKNSTIRIFSESKHSFSIDFKSGDVETIKKIQAALNLAEDYLSS